MVCRIVVFWKTPSVPFWGLVSYVAQLCDTSTCLREQGQVREREGTDIGGIGQVVQLDLLRHGSPDVDPMVVACRDGDAGRTQREAEEPAEAEGVRHGEGRARSRTLLSIPHLEHTPESGRRVIYP